jgi:hypothetical protein
MGALDGCSEIGTLLAPATQTAVEKRRRNDAATLHCAIEGNVCCTVVTLTEIYRTGKM